MPTLSPKGKARMVNFFARNIQFTSAADAPLSVRLRLPPSPTRWTRPFCRFATFSPFHRGYLPVSSGIFARFIGDICPFHGRAYPRWESRRNIVFYNKKDYIFIFFRKICSLFLAFFNVPIFILQHYFGVVFVRLHICLCLIKTRNNRLIRRLIVAKRIKYLIFFREKSPLLYEFHFVFVRLSLRRIVEYF